MRLTVLGTGTARPVADSAASGILIEAGSSAVLFDIGSGVASKLEASIGAAGLTGLVIGHFHADHWIDVAPLRYRFPWGEPAPLPLPVFMPRLCTNCSARKGWGLRSSPSKRRRSLMARSRFASTPAATPPAPTGRRS